MDDDQKIIDGQITSDATPSEVAKTGELSSSDTIISLTSLIQGYLETIARDRGELSENRGMLEDALNNDEGYKQACDKVKETTKMKKTAKSQLMRLPNIMQLDVKIKDLATQIKEQTQAMSDLLQQYAKLTGATTFEDSQGNVKQIIYVAKLVSPKA